MTFEHTWTRTPFRFLRNQGGTTIVSVMMKTFAIGLLSALLAGCAAPLPSAPLSAPSAASPTAVSSPVRSPPPSLAVGPTSMPAGYVLDQGTFPTIDTTPLQDVKTDGSVVFWSTGVNAAPDTAPDLRAALPGAAPKRIFANPNRDSSLLPITGWGGRYAFVEANPRLYGLNGWRLWYLDHAGATPVHQINTQGQQLAVAALVFAGLALVSPDPQLGQLFSTLADGWPDDAATQRVRMVTIGHAMSYETWRSLTDRGLSDGEASELMLRLVTTVEGGGEPRNQLGEAWSTRLSVKPGPT